MQNGEPSPASMAATESKSVSELCRLYVERSGADGKRTNDDSRRIDRYILPQWGGRPVTSLKAADIAEHHGKIGEHSPHEANRQLILIQRLLDAARQWGFVDKGWPNPAAGIPIHPESVRDAWSPW